MRRKLHCVIFELECKLPRSQALIVWPDENGNGLYLLDVSGHGVPAALLSVALARQLSPASSSSSLLRDAGTDANGWTRFAAPAEVARSLNEWLLANPTAEQFFTMIDCIREAPSLRLRYVSAGHPPMFVAHADRSVDSLPSTGSLIGVVRDATFEEKVFTLRTGDRVLLYSDGITKAFNESKELFGANRVHDVLANGTERPIEAVLKELLKKVLAWSQGRPNDDLSLLAVESQ